MNSEQYEYISHIINTLKKQKFPVTDEKVTQLKISEHLTKSGIAHTREFELSDGDDIPDFRFDHGVFAEVKIKGNKMHIFKQCKRYCENEVVQALILISAKTTPLPREINGKRILTFNLSMAWL